MRICPYCEMGLETLDIKVAEQLVWDGSKWVLEKSQSPDIICSECGSVLDSSILSQIKVSKKVITQVEQRFR